MVYMKNPESSLPPGFRFHPTDEELILHYLKKKLTSTPFPLSIIADVDIYKFDPWDLPGLSLFLLIACVLWIMLDDWVLCRIYRKFHVSSPTSNAIASDQDQEEEEEQFVQETLLPILKSSPAPTLNPQKSSSFSNLVDAMDYSMLSNFLSDNQIYQTGFESAPMNTTTPGILDQPAALFNNNVITNNNSSFMNQKLPQLSSASVPNNLENNKLKRPHSSIITDHHHHEHPSKKHTMMTNSSSTDHHHHHHQFDPHQYNFLHQSFFNQQLLLSPHNLNFQG
ncbi:hypothetical protein EZV62_007530 [Acer yangbiense]|uniref:NAC domain-containing protein n=1 Tax=Acer yangbiense TaxID=1000413 RepID=A0A5C7IAJ4_9ROSI|nr:hypothetical protein EZV62_007530 [Acer yangbiense]